MQSAIVQASPMVSPAPNAAMSTQCLTNGSQCHRCMRRRAPHYMGGQLAGRGAGGLRGGSKLMRVGRGGASQGRARAEPLRDRAHDRIQVELGGTPQSVGRPNGRPTIRCAGAD
jgi:hypothetical protein